MLEFKSYLGNRYTENFYFSLLILLNGNIRFLQCELKFILRAIQGHSLECLISHSSHINKIYLVRICVLFLG